MKRRLLALGVGLLLAGALMPAPALAAEPVLDQHNYITETLFGMDDPFSFSGQGFTVGKSGTLASISLWIHCGTPSQPELALINLTLVAVNASGLPSGSYLGGGTGWTSIADTWVSFPMSSAKLTVGQRVAVLISAHYHCNIHGSKNNDYAGGMAIYYGNGAWHPRDPGGKTDFAFRTYMKLQLAMPVPLPISSLSSASAAAPSVAPAPLIPSAPAESPTSTPAQTETAQTEASPSDASPSPSAAAASATATPAAGTGGSGDPGGPPVAAIAAGIVALGGLGCLVAFLLLRRRKPLAEVPAPVAPLAPARKRRSGAGKA